MPEEHGNWHITTYSKGVERDAEPELVYAQGSAGIYYDGRNCRPISVEGTTGTLQKIKGETLLYPNNTLLTNYTCTEGISVNTHIVEIWMPTTGIGPGIIRVDGVVVLQSAAFVLDLDKVQYDKNESKIAGEIFITDDTVPPYVFVIDDLVASLISDPNKYFSAFDPLLYQINLQSPLDRPIFVALKNVGGGGGKPVGQYRYSMRYGNTEGDRTQWSVSTDMIPIMESLSQQSFEYPWVKTYGGPPNPQSVTDFGIHLRFRVTNIYNYDFIEIKCTSYNAGAGIDFTPNGVVVAAIPISPGEISVRDYIDPGNSNVNTPLSETDETQQLAEIQSAKSIRYFNRRIVLMNIKLASKASSLSFLTTSGKQGFPVIDRLGGPGYNDPWNHVYRRSFMRGETESLGVVGFDGVGTSGFVEKIPDLTNFTMPNRRDPISSDTNDYSFYGTVRAATTGVNAVDQTHEVFDLISSGAKSDVCDFKNILRSGKLGLTSTKLLSTVAGSSSDCVESSGQVTQHGAHVTILSEVSVYYKPFTPVRQNDSDVTGHNYVTNVGVYPDDSTESGYRPHINAPNYYAMGLMVSGVTNFPKWMKAFSVVRTPSAKRVICQGLGFYSMNPAIFDLVGSDTLATKDANKFWFYSPDIESGNVSSNTVNDMIQNPQNYGLQFVSPLGFASEVFSFKDNAVENQRDRLIDMISYVRMISDLKGSNAIINPNEDINMGIPDGASNYVAYDKWRNTGQNPNFFGGDPNKGNRVVDIAQVNRKSEGRGNFLEFQTQSNFYGAIATGGSGNNHFNDQGMKNWTEPMYIINIVRTGDIIRDQNIQGFTQTTHYQKLESIIGKGTGLADQKYLLVDERWEDCISAPNSTIFGASTPRFIFIKHPNGIIDTWVNVTYMTTAQVSTIVANITAFGFDTVGGVIVKGVYRHENILNQDRFYNIVFDEPGFFPAVNDLILVRYDNTAPIRVYGGDAFIGEAIFAPIDREANSQDDEAETQFALGLGFPYHRWKLNPRYYTIKDASSTVNTVQSNIRPRLGFLRQLCAMFTCETRCGLHYAYNSDYPNQFYPLINYVMRPANWDDDKGITDNHIWSTYGSDYPNENGNWKWGGFRFLQQVNPDYSTEPPLEYFSRPEYGFVERVDFPDGIMWSLPRVINVQNSPSLKTFPANNLFNIDDSQGEIKFAWDATTTQGENLYAFTNKGICLLITNKNILSDQNSNQLGFTSGGFVQQQYWLSKEIGMFDEFWRSAAVGHIPIATPQGSTDSPPDGSEIPRMALFFANNESVYRFMDNQIVDIGRMGFYSKIYQQALKNVQPGFGTKMTAIYDRFYKEYWLYIKDNLAEVDNTFVFGQKTNKWYGTNDYKFDKFTSVYNKTYGHRNLETYELDSGFIINGAPIQFEAISAAAPEQNWDKEFIRVRINTVDGVKPNRVEFYKDESLITQCALDPSIPGQGSFYLKNYRGWENQIPRTDISVNATKPRMQGRLILYKIIHNLASTFKLIDTSILYKDIKGGK